MTNITALKKKQVVDEHLLQGMEEIIAKARAGEVTEIIMVAGGTYDDEPSFMRVSSFEDTWRVLGALEYAKDGVLKGAGVKQWT